MCSFSAKCARDLAVLALGLSGVWMPLPEAQAFEITTNQSVSNPEPHFKDYFGRAVAPLGHDRFVVGSSRYQSAATNAGTAHLFDHTGSLLVTLTNPAPADNDHFGSAVAAIGSGRIAVAADADDLGATDAGTVYLFDTNGALLVTVSNPAPAFGDGFGVSLAGVGTDRLVIGACNDDADGMDAGRVYIYNTAGTLLVTVTNPAPAAADRFGWRVAALGSDRFLVGVPYNDGGTEDEGAVYLYGIGGDLLLTVTNPTPEAYDGFGCDVACVGTNYLLVGASCDDTVGTDAGSAYLYDVSGALLVTITNPAANSFDSFGGAVCGIGHGRILIGADGAGSYNMGCAWVFGMSGELLVGMTNPAAGWDEHFGYAVSPLGNDRYLVASPYAPSGGSGDQHKAGRVYLYSFAEGRRYYVNDTSTVGDVWCAAAGDDAHSGLASNEPKATVQAIVDAYDLEACDIVYIDTGRYLLTNNITVTEEDGGSTNGMVTFVGTEAGSILDRGITVVTNRYAFDLNNVTHVKLERLTITNGFYGIYLTNADFCVVEDLVFRDAQDVGLHLCDADANELRGVDIRGCKDGIYMFKSTLNTVRNGLVWSNRGNGLYFRDSCISTRVDSCTVAFNAYRQIDLVGRTTSLKLENSIVLAEGLGNYCVALNADAYYVYPKYSGDHNDLYARDGASVGLFYGSGSSFYQYRLGDWQYRVRQDTNSLGCDPLFADAGTGDFHLKSRTGRINAAGAWVADAVHSPCIDTGDPLSDYSLETEPDGSRRNIGAYAGSPEASRSVEGPWLHVVNLYDDGTLWSDHVEIRWLYGQLGDGDLVDIAYSLDEGLSWSNVALSVAVADRLHVWVADVGFQRDVLCRVSLSTNSSVADTNDVPFELSPGPAVYYVNDGSTDGDVYCSAPGDDDHDGRSPGQPKATIENVLAGGATYDSVIWLDTGSYAITNSILLAKGESLSGSPAGTIISYDGTNQEAAIAVLHAARVANLVITGSHHGVVCSDVNRALTLSNLTFRGIGGDGIAADDCDQLSLRNIAVESCPDAGSGVYLSGCSGVHVQGLRVAGVGGYGLYMNWCDDGQLSELELLGCGAAGIRLQASSRNRLSHVLSCGNAGPGIELLRNSYFAVNYPTYWYRYIPSDSNSVEHSTIAFNETMGQIYEEHEKGVYTDRYNNHGLPGSYSHERFAYPLRMANCIVLASGSGRYCVVSSQSDAYKTEPAYEGNYNAWATLNGAQLGYLKRNYGDVITQSNLADWVQAFGHDADSLCADPLFVDPARHDYHLRSSVSNGTYVNVIGGWTNFPGENSPCIDTGDPGRPYVGEPDPNGGVVNLGAYGNTAHASRSADSDNDGLSDTLEQHRVGSNPDDPDSDDDGASDRDEHIAGMSATNAASVFRAVCAEQPEGVGFIIQWPSANGRAYRVYRAISLENGFSEIASGVQATPPMNTFTDAPSSSISYYRVEVE